MACYCKQLLSGWMHKQHSMPGTKHNAPDKEACEACMALDKAQSRQQRRTGAL